MSTKADFSVSILLWHGADDSARHEVELLIELKFSEMELVLNVQNLISLFPLF